MRYESKGEEDEMIALGYKETEMIGFVSPPNRGDNIDKHAIHVPDVLNEAYDYDSKVSFSRAIQIQKDDMAVLLISGTASVDENGATIHKGDFRAQLWRTYRNITNILQEAGMSWGQVVRTTCYLRDIERDYDDFNEIRNWFFDWLELKPYPASTGIQARLCREDLLIEIEAIAVDMK